MKKCLLIGGAGFIGSNLAVCLDNAGYDVTICDYIDKECLPDRLLKLKYKCLNYFEEAINDDIIRQQDMIVLLISSVGPNSSMEKPEQCYGKDIIRMLKLLEQIRKCAVNRLVFISSGGTVYGNQNRDKFREDMETFPINHYGIMKLTQEKILLMYNNLYGMNNVIFRLANPYGPGQRVSSGIGAVTTFLQNIMNGEKIHIYGEGKAVRDYIYIDDAVNMMRMLLDKEENECEIPVFNIGTGVGKSIAEVLEIVEKVTKRKAEVEFLGGREIDVSRNVLDISKICRVIGDYKCRILEDGVGEYYNLLRSKLDLKQG